MGAMIGGAIRAALMALGFGDVSLASLLFGKLWALLPAEWEVDTEPYVMYWQMGETWFCLNHLMMCIGLYVTFWSGFVVLKAVLKAIPTVG